jgi:hypothetical protein
MLLILPLAIYLCLHMYVYRAIKRAVESENISNVRAVMRMYMTELDLNPVDEVKIKRYLGDPSVLPASEKAKAAARIEEARASLSAPERYEVRANFPLGPARPPSFVLNIYPLIHR